MPTSDRSTAASRGRAVCGAALLALLLLLVPVASASGSASASTRTPASVDASAATPALVTPGRVEADASAATPALVALGLVEADASVPPPTDNDYIPADQNLSNCVGTLELPNCGSPAKSDLRLYLTFAVLMLGMAFIGWRITVMVRRRDRSLPEPDHTF